MVLYKLKQAEEIQKMIESPKIRPKGFQITRDHTYSYFRIATKKSRQPHAKFGVFFFLENHRKLQLNLWPML